MYEDDIRKVDEWFESHTDYYGTYHEDEEYGINHSDLEAFSDFLRQEFPDLASIRCYFSKGDTSIWFHLDDLKKARFY